MNKPGVVIWLKWDNQILPSRNLEIRDQAASAGPWTGSDKKPELGSGAWQCAQRSKGSQSAEREERGRCREKSKGEPPMALETQTEWPQSVGLLGPGPKPSWAWLAFLSLDPLRQPPILRIQPLFAQAIGFPSLRQKGLLFPLQPRLSN